MKKNKPMVTCSARHLGLYLAMCCASAALPVRAAVMGDAVDAPDAIDSPLRTNTGAAHESNSPSVATPASNPYAKFDRYVPKGLTVSFPGPAASIAPDPGGLRSRLHEHGWGYFGYSSNSFTYDVRNHGDTDGGEQVYSGQKATFSSTNVMYLSYDLERNGVENGQFTVSLANYYGTWKPGGVNNTHISMLRYYRTFGQGKVELSMGNLTPTSEYVGTYVGGNLASGTFGVNASVPSQAGLGSSLQPRPGVNVKVHLGGGFYDMIGYHRSRHPDGSVAEHDANPSGLTLDGDHVGNLWINEFGFRRNASPSQRDVWVRGGYIGNSSDFRSLKNPGTRQDDNHAAYILADRQLISFANGSPQVGRGIYGGFSYMYAPEDMNPYSKYAELRLYAKGPFDARPYDMLSLVVSRNTFSKYAIRNAQETGLPTEDESIAVSLSYSGAIARGVVLTGGFSYLDHPRPISTSESQSSGLNLQTGLSFWF